MGLRVLAVEQKPAAPDAFEEIQALLRAASSAGTPHRLSAVRYTLCRAALLESPLRPAVPGFIVQCVSIYKFYDFIHLYDPKVEARISFVEEAFSGCRALLNSKSVYDVFNDPDF
jgi:hypothetical protein